MIRRALGCTLGTCVMTLAGLTALGANVFTSSPVQRACVIRRASSLANRVRPAVGPTQLAWPNRAISCSTADFTMSDVAAEWAGSLTAQVAGMRPRSIVAINCRATVANSWCRSTLRSSAVESSWTVTFKWPT